MGAVWWQEGHHKMGPFTPHLGYSGKIVLKGGPWGTVDQSQSAPFPTDEISCHHQLLGKMCPSVKSAPSQLPLVYVWDMKYYGMEYPFGHFRPAVLAMLPASFLCLSSLAENDTLNLGQALLSNN